MTLSDIIEALEGASRFSRDVDIAIFKYLHPEYAGYVEGRGGLVHPNDGSDQRVLSDVRWPSYTSSLDAAMHLAISKLDDGATDIEVAHRSVAGNPHGRAEICGPTVFGMAKSKTPAMALVLATLKALQAKEPDEKPKPACRHIHDHVVCAGRGAAFNVYRCRYCGDEEWL